MNETSKKNQYKREHYKRIEICFKKEDWGKIEEYLKKNNTTLKEIILDKIK